MIAFDYLWNETIKKKKIQNCLSYQIEKLENGWGKKLKLNVNIIMFFSLKKKRNLKN